MSVALDVIGNIVASCGSDDVSISANGSKIHCQLANKNLLPRLLAHFPTRKRRIKTINNFHRALAFAELSLVVSLDNEEIARLGQESRAGILSRVLGLGSLEINFWWFLKNWWSIKR